MKWLAPTIGQQVGVAPKEHWGSTQPWPGSCRRELHVQAHSCLQLQRYKAHRHSWFPGIPPGRDAAVWIARVYGDSYTQMWKLFDLEVLSEERRWKPCSSGPDTPAWPYFLWLSKEEWKAARAQKPHRQPIPLTRGGATPSRQRHRAAEQQAPPPKDTLEEQMNDKLISHRTVKLRCHEKIIYWASSIPSWLICTWG